MQRKRRKLILWNNKKISAVLDWELSGIGNKEFDIAWAIINRPSQKFLKTDKGRELAHRYGYTSQHAVDNLVHKYKDYV